MSVRQLIPQDLASIAPDPELARVLAGIELSRLSGFDCVDVLKAQYRQANHERARVMAAMVEVGMCGAGAAGDELRRMAADEFSADEIRAALMLTRRAADGQFWLAHDLLTRLPEVHAAMDAGELDEPRARVFSEWTTGLSDDQARAVCTRLLPRVPKLTTGQLIEQLKKLAIAIDPDWARRRYEQAIAERKVVGYRNPDGSANLSRYNLPLDRVAAASGHIDALAKAAKRAGDPRLLDHIRADLFLGMTAGTYSGLDDAIIRSANELMARTGPSMLVIPEMRLPNMPSSSARRSRPGARGLRQPFARAAALGVISPLTTRAASSGSSRLSRATTRSAVSDRSKECVSRSLLWPRPGPEPCWPAVGTASLASRSTLLASSTSEPHSAASSREVTETSSSCGQAPPARRRRR
ncbi:MAG: DUF222 domain-containing protein [Pseudonocardiaceae bacterium]